MNPVFQKIGFSPADILLPHGVDLSKWAVVACDQFTSQPDYWRSVEEKAGDAPSALRLILSEAKLSSPEVEQHIADINKTMKKYLDGGVFEALPDSLIYVERTQSDGAVRRGIIGKIDLEAYDYTPGSGSLIRATEGTVLSRIPPRVRVRREAPLELPHVMLLMDDPADTVLSPLRGGAGMQRLYGFPLMLGGGSVRGWKLTDAQTAGAAKALSALCAPAEQARKYGVKNTKPLLFAVGDGNHSLAAAKQCYEELKKTVPQAVWADLPARYALVEVVNLHDPALQFEAIHRVLFDVKPSAFIKAFLKAFPGAHEGKGDGHSIQFLWEGHAAWYTVPKPSSQLAVGTLQGFLDAWTEKHGGRVDYVHGDDAARTLGVQPGNMGFLLPAMGKNELFKTVLSDGVLPRKTFSMGNAEDKRYYLEARRIR